MNGNGEPNPLAPFPRREAGTAALAANGNDTDEDAPNNGASASVA